MLDMTSVCLSTKGNSPTGSQDLCHCHQMWEKFQVHEEKVQQAICRAVRSPGCNLTCIGGLGHPHQDDLAEEEYDPYDGVERPPGKLVLAVGEKGLGTGGCVPVPNNIWDKHAPVSLDWALCVLPDQGHSGRMARDGLLGVARAPCPSQFRAFAKSKNATKGALIADLRELTSLIPKPLLFKLPSLGQWGFPLLRVQIFETQAVFHQIRHF